jgi:hypothetical protein
MKHFSKIILLLLLTNTAFAEENLEYLSKKSSELQADFKKCGFCVDKRHVLDSFNEDKLMPALEQAGKAIQKKPNKWVSKLIIDIALENQSSADESFSYVLGDAYLADSVIFLQLVGNLKTADEKKIILDKTDWGIQNHTNLPKKEIDKILMELGTLRVKANLSDEPDASRSKLGLTGTGTKGNPPDLQKNGFLISFEDSIERIKIQDLGFSSKNIGSEEIKKVANDCKLNLPAARARFGGQIMLLFSNDVTGKISSFKVETASPKDEAFKKCVHQRIEGLLNKI